MSLKDTALEREMTEEGMVSDGTRIGKWRNKKWKVVSCLNDNRSFYLSKWPTLRTKVADFRS